MIPRRQKKKNQKQYNIPPMLLLFASMIAASTRIITLCDASSSSSSTLFGVIQQQQHQELLQHPSLFRRRQHHRVVQNPNSHHTKDLIQILRGGSTSEEAVADEDDVEVVVVDDDIEDDDDEDEEEDEDNNAASKLMSSKPLKILVVTNWGNSVLDHRIELNSVRTRDVASLKKSLSRQIPGRPPIISLELVYEGRILDDEMLVDELFDDDDEDEEDEEEDEEGDDVSKTLILNVVPPVEPKFAIELVPKLMAHEEDDDDTLSTEELIDAFFLNQAAMARNALLMADPNTPSSPLMRMEIQEIAKQLREQLESQTPTEVWNASLEPVRKNHTTEERRGQRYRSGKGGARTSLKKSIQHNMNIHWGETIRNCMLLLFFGYFGGRNTLSRSLMIWGAPMCFVLQARPVKMWFKIFFYMMIHPPSIVLSLLPAPQQAILAFDENKSYAALYNPGGGGDGVEDKAGNKKSIVADDEKENDDDDDEEEEEEEEYDSEEEEEEEESSDEYDSEDEEEE